MALYSNLNPSPSIKVSDFVLRRVFLLCWRQIMSKSAAHLSLSLPLLVVLLNSFPPQGGERKPKMLIPPCMIREFHLQVPPRRPAMTAARLRTTLWTTPTVSSTHAWQQQPNNPPHRLNKHGSITLDSLVLHLYTSRRVTFDVKNIHEQ